MPAVMTQSICSSKLMVVSEFLRETAARTSGVAEKCPAATAQILRVALGLPEPN
jgi:hypothetical protein